MTKSQTQMAAKQEAIEIVRRLYEKLSTDIPVGSAFGYGTLNGIALAKLEIELEM